MKRCEHVMGRSEVKWERTCGLEPGHDGRHQLVGHWDFNEGSCPVCFATQEQRNEGGTERGGRLATALPHHRGAER